MRTTERSDTYLVLEDFGARLGRAWRETDADATDRETLIRNLMDGQYGIPLRIVAFNTAEGWSRDVTKDIADELRRRLMEYDEVPSVGAGVRRGSQSLGAALPAPALKNKSLAHSHKPEIGCSRYR